MHIYGFMYFARLIEVMEAEYPTVRFLLGEEAFAGHARHFLSLNPSNNPNLSHLSRDFPDFLAEDARDLTHRGFAHALAQVERTLEELFDAPGDEPVAMEVLSAIPMERWANARLKTPRAFRLLRLSYPVNAFLNARRADHFAPVPELQPTLMVCFRRGFSLRRLELSEVQYGLLEALDEGCTLGDALERASDLPDTDEDALLGSLHSWFEGWMSEGLFVAVELD